MTDNADLPETLSTYLRLRGLKAPNRRRKRVRIDEDDPAAPFMPGRDPHSIDSVLADLTKKSGWGPPSRSRRPAAKLARNRGRRNRSAHHSGVIGRGRAHHSMRLNGVGKAAAADAFRHHDADRRSPSRGQSFIDPLLGAGRTLLEMGSTHSARPGPSRYLRLNHLRRYPQPFSRGTGPYVAVSGRFLDRLNAD